MKQQAAKVANMTNGMHIYGWSITSKMVTYGWNNRRANISRGNDNTLAWVNCSGVPLNAWCASFLKKLFRAFSEAVLVNEKTISRHRLDRGRSLVIILYDSSCPSKINMVMGRERFQVSVSEDHSPVDGFRGEEENGGQIQPFANSLEGFTNATTLKSNGKEKIGRKNIQVRFYQHDPKAKIVIVERTVDQRVYSSDEEDESLSSNNIVRGGSFYNFSTFKSESSIFNSKICKGDFMNLEDKPNDNGPYSESGIGLIETCPQLPPS
ncbi:hypothetical protein QYF36_023951 [Acer negundo]|nr:hypothetical protein QYF36_023951 [Acer negundo]